MKQKIIDDLEKCIRLIVAGIPIEKCLEEFPANAIELNELLKTAELVNSLQVEKTPLDGKARSQVKLLTLAEELSSGDKRVKDSSVEWSGNPFKKVVQSIGNLRPLARRLVLALVLACLFLLFSSGLFVTSAKSLPGDSLYPVKRVIEDIKVYLAPSLEVRHEFEHEYSIKRVDEVVMLMGLARDRQISFEGTVFSINSTKWMVSGISVIVNPDTTIFVGTGEINKIVPGMSVEVEGNTSPQGWVYANEIHLREYQFNGIVQELKSDLLKISGTLIAISPYTQIDPGIQVGDEVTVLIRSEDDGLVALAILRELHPEITAETNFSIEVTPTPDKYPISNEGDEQYLIGILDSVSDNYWSINGHNFNIISNTEISEDINIGDVISVKYRIEPNGSFTAIEINKNDDDFKPEEVEKITIEQSEDQDEHRTTEATSTHATETEESGHHREAEETPEPHEDHP